MTAAEQAQVVAALEELTRTQAEVDRQRLIIAALKSGLTKCLEWMPCAEVRSWPPGFRLRDEAVAEGKAALALANKAPAAVIPVSTVEYLQLRERETWAAFCAHRSDADLKEWCKALQAFNDELQERTRLLCVQTSAAQAR